MLIARSELKALEGVLERADPAMLNFHLQQNFHLLFLGIFDEAYEGQEKSIDFIDPQKRSADMAVDILRPKKSDDLSCFNYIWFRMENLRFRDRESGEWYRYIGTQWDQDGPRVSNFQLDFFADIAHDLLSPVRGKAKRHARVTADELLSLCKAYLDSSPRLSTAFVPASSRPSRHSITSPLMGHTRQLLKELRAGEIDLASVSWRDLEEIVAELLRSRGLKVNVTGNTRDGGRDIIAQGEFVEGVPATIAVEIKHKATVGIRDVRDALYANRNFPLILLVTSGRFSAGVVTESRIAENRFRLILKDGVALQDWLVSKRST